MARMPDHLTIGELSSRSGVAASALRFYEEVGLLEAERTTGNQRRYPRHMLRRVAFIRAAQRVGLTLDEIGDGAGDAARPAYADQGRLGAGLPALDRAHRPADRRPAPAQAQAHRLRRLRVPEPAYLRRSATPMTSRARSPPVPHGWPPRRTPASPATDVAGVDRRCRGRKPGVEGSRHGAAHRRDHRRSPRW